MTDFEIDKWFDKYSFQARLRPALLSLFPVFITIAVSFPALYELAKSLLSLTIACGVTVAFAHLARKRGREIQNRLIREWGGLPSTLWLRHADEHLETETKKRYHNFLQNNVLNWKAPTPEEELADPAKADSRYGSAARWLLEYTRDAQKFPLIFTENISYGFRRNTLGLKPIGFLISLISTAYPAWRLYGMNLELIFANHSAQLTVGLSSLVMLLGWCCVVTKSWVRDAADAYAKALLAACDS